MPHVEQVCSILLWRQKMTEPFSLQKSLAQIENADKPASLLDLNDNNILPRLLLLSCLGLCVAGALTWFMHFLIESSHQQLDTSKRAQFLDFVRVKQEEVSERKTTLPDRPKMNEVPEAPQAPSESENTNSSNAINISPLPVANDFQLDTGGYGMSMNDGDYLPIVKIAPIYPMRAQKMGLEGTCVVSYTVTNKGTIKDPIVLEQQCTHPVFHRVSIDAALKFKYKPRVIDGDAIEVPNVKNRFIFELDK